MVSNNFTQKCMGTARHTLRGTFFMLHKLDNHDLFSGVENRHPFWGPPVYVGTCDFTNLALTRDKNIAGSKFIHERRG